MQTGRNRTGLEKYYTQQSTVDLCIGYFKNNVIIEENDIIIEPSAGNGAFIQGIKTLSTNHIFYDIAPDHPEIVQLDFLKYDNPINDLPIHIIGNPPFGNCSQLANRFIKKSAQFAKTIAFILPPSFKGDHNKKAFPLNFHLIFEKDLPFNSFLVDNKPYNLKSVFQIWVKKDFDRPVAIPYTPINYKFVKKTDEYDIAIRRVGRNSGIIMNHSGIHGYNVFYIKLDDSIYKPEFIELYNKNIDYLLDYAKNHYVAIEHITKNILIKHLNTIVFSLTNYNI